MFGHTWFQRLLPICLLILILMAVRPARAVQPVQAASTVVAGTLVMIQGDVAVRRGGTDR
jgi:hypothetical protein